MVDKELKKILNNMEIPEPDEAAKEATIAAAMTEFARQNATSAKKIKGIERSDRLTGTLLSKLTYLGECIMKKRYIWSGAVTACLIVLVFGVSQLLEESKQVLPMVEPGEIQVVQPTPPAKTETTEVLSADVAAVEEEAVTMDMVTIKPAPAPQAKAIKKEQPGRVLQKESKKMAETSGAANLKLMRKSDMNSQLMAVQAPSSFHDRPVAPPPQYNGNDKFEDVVVNPVKRVAEEPVSTFSVDVDTASYAFVRKMLNQGTLPPKDAVRVEELINYFDYDYRLPIDKTKPFLPTVAVYPTPWNPDTKLLHIGIRGYDIKPAKKPKTNLVFLIDVSGSMNQPDKLPLLKNAFKMLVNNLQETDTVAMVVYAGAAGTVLEPTSVKDKNRILSSLENLSAGGSTAGGEGIRQAYALAEANFDKKGVNRVILATDGDFNVGITNQEELKGFVERKRKTGIFLSVIGFGQGNYNDALMQKLAQNGNGNASYIDNLNEARKVLVEEASSTLFTIAKDVKIQIEFNPAQVAEYRLIGYETRMLKREDFNNDQVDAGDIGSGHRVTAIYEITEPGSKSQLVDDLRYGQQQPVADNRKGKTGEFAFLKIRFKAPDSETSELMTIPVTTENEFKTLNQVPGEIRFAAAVAAYGQLLRQDPYTKGFSYDEAIALALPARGEDPFGLRNEFISLLRLAKSASALPSP